MLTKIQRRKKITRQIVKRRMTYHLTKRANQRFGLILNRKARIELIRLIQQGKGEVIEKQPDNIRKVVRVPIYLSEEMRKLNSDIKPTDCVNVVYDSKFQCIVTMY